MITVRIAGSSILLPDLLPLFLFLFYYLIPSTLSGNYFYLLPPSPPLCSSLSLRSILISPHLIHPSHLTSPSTYLLTYLPIYSLSLSIPRQWDRPPTASRLIVGVPNDEHLVQLNFIRRLIGSVTAIFIPLHPCYIITVYGCLFPLALCVNRGQNIGANPSALFLFTVIELSFVLCRSETHFTPKSHHDHHIRTTPEERGSYLYGYPRRQI